MDERQKYWSKASEILPHTGHTGELQKLKCHLLYLQKHQYSLSTDDKTLVSSACPHCFMEFQSTQFSLQLIPSKKPSRNLQKILVKKGTSQFLTGVQRTLLAKYEETHGKKLVIKCAICQKETEIILKKQKRDRSKRLPVSTVGNDDGNLKSKAQPKKKKKKDQFAGLKASAVMSLKSKRKMP